MLLVVGETVYPAHRHLAETVPVLAAKLRHDDVGRVRLWGHDLVTLTLRLPFPSDFAHLVLTQIYGCRCDSCYMRLRDRGDRRVLQRNWDYLNPGAKLV